MALATGDTVTIEYVGRLDDDTVFDTSREEVATETGLVDEQPDREFGPLTVELGAGRIIEGLEEALLGEEVGATGSVTIPPEKAYGQPDDDRVAEYGADQFREMVADEPAEGMYVQSEQGAPGRIVHLDDEVVRIDFNHELAGETLTFEYEIVDAE